MDELHFDPSIRNNLEIIKSEFIRKYLVKLEKKDFRRNIHIYYTGPYADKKRPGDWRVIFNDKTWLPACAKEIIKNNYGDSLDPYSLEVHKFRSEEFSQYKKDYATIKSICDNYDFKKLTELCWVLIGRKKEGPFMLLDGNHRACGFFIKIFIEKSEKFQPIYPVLCAISEDEDRGLFHHLDYIQNFKLNPFEKFKYS